MLLYSIQHSQLHNYEIKAIMTVKILDLCVLFQSLLITKYQDWFFIILIISFSR